MAASISLSTRSSFAPGRGLVDHHHVLRHLPATARRSQRRDPEVLAQHRRALMGRRDHRPDDRGAGGDPPSHVPAGPLDAGTSAAGAGNEAAPGALQGRQAAPAAGDDEVLPGARSESAWLVPPARAAAAVLLLALLPAA